MLIYTPRALLNCRRLSKCRLIKVRRERLGGYSYLYKSGGFHIFMKKPRWGKKKKKVILLDYPPFIRRDLNSRLL